MQRKIIFYELNEVPTRIVDAFCRWRPDSTLARRRSDFVTYETFSGSLDDSSVSAIKPSKHRQRDPEVTGVCGLLESAPARRIDICVLAAYGPRQRPDFTNLCPIPLQSAPIRCLAMLDLAQPCRWVACDQEPR